MTPDDLIYLAYPLDRTGDARPDDLARLTGWREAVRIRLIHHQQPFYDPGAALVNWPGARAASAARAINQVAAGRSGGMIALLPPGIPTIGTPIEIERHWFNGHPVAVIHEGEPSVMLNKRGIRLFNVAQADSDIHSVIEAAVDWLVEQDNGDTESPHRLLAVQRLHDNGQLPIRMYDDDAAFDLMVSEDTEIGLGTFADIPCGIAVQMPPHTWGLIIGRSSTLRKRGLIVTPAVIDGGYRGPLFAGCYNLNSQGPVVKIEAGERLAQFIPFHNVANTLTPGWVAALSPSDRGERGFGSSGA